MEIREVRMEIGGREGGWEGKVGWRGKVGKVSRMETGEGREDRMEMGGREGMLRATKWVQRAYTQQSVLNSANSHMCS